MSAVGSSSWCERVTAALAPLAATDGAESELDVVVTDGPDGSTRVRWSARGARFLGVVPVDDGDAPAPTEVSFTADALLDALTGQLDAAVEFMRGDLKPAGATGPWLDWLTAVADPATRAALRAVLAD